MQCGSGTELANIVAAARSEKEKKNDDQEHLTGASAESSQDPIDCNPSAVC